MIPHFRLSTGDAHTEAYCIMSIYECPNPYERLTNAKSLCILCAPPLPTTCAYSAYATASSLRRRRGRSCPSWRSQRSRTSSAHECICAHMCAYVRICVQPRNAHKCAYTRIYAQEQHNERLCALMCAYVRICAQSRNAHKCA